MCEKEVDIVKTIGVETKELLETSEETWGMIWRLDIRGWRMSFTSSF